ncbi:3'-5' exonuclease [Clostridium frigidicarnis]|uniref:DNA polymerase-3 subunit epsilon n=1 Tax=Clostridium frigidicarnis TaxID=84698 RepID=A0A1I0ZAU1_9CLOT|nr:3'-5' exonuclease [Clostridium frigidicarnis]SFB22487.1 DNA polymerase-3 subunit epsilon [Clostridium frigidicarnis]
MKLIFFDTETTDIKPDIGSICQLSYIIVDTSTKPNSIEGKNFFFTVEHMSPSAEKIHGFSLEKLYDLSSGEYFEDKLEYFLNDFLDADILIGHNVSFDIKFLCHELEGIGEIYSPKNKFCTMNYYKNICKIPKANGEIKNPKLVEAVQFFGLTDNVISKKADTLFKESGNYHDARFDVAATYLIVTEGIRKGLIPSFYFTNMAKQ